MPRHARILLPGLIYHVVQRGHNLEVVFRRDVDRFYYLSNLRDLRVEFGCKIFGFCLMPNHVHLMVRVGEDPKILSDFMKHVAGRQTRYFNREYQRTGTLWESRFHSSPVDNEQYLLACSRYIELNPVRAGLVATPSAYRWSSFRAKAMGGWPKWLDADPWYQSLGDSPKDRQSKYDRVMHDMIPEKEWEALRDAVQQNKAVGPETFLQQTEKAVGWDTHPHPRGRPLKNKEKRGPKK